MTNHGSAVPSTVTAPSALKVVARIAAIFWAIKLLTTAFGESTSDYLVLVVLVERPHDRLDDEPDYDEHRRADNQVADERLGPLMESARDEAGGDGRRGERPTASRFRMRPGRRIKGKRKPDRWRASTLRLVGRVGLCAPTG
jgi:hypothetical protein